MQQVECFLNGTLEYSQISGDTGPVVYPAGHLYIYTFLYYLTSHGTNIYLAQYIFAGLYLVTLILVFRLYGKYSKVNKIFYLKALIIFEWQSDSTVRIDLHVLYFVPRTLSLCLKII